MARVRRVFGGVVSCVLVVGLVQATPVTPAPLATSTDSASSPGQAPRQPSADLEAAGKTSGERSIAAAMAPVGPVPPARRVKELVADRMADSRSFAMSDGRVQAELSAGPVNYRDAQGHWQPIDTRIRGVAGRPGFAYGNTSNQFASLFGRSSDQLLRVEQGGRQVTLGLARPAATLAPTLRGSTIVYGGALGAGADLVWRVTPQGVKEQLVLAGRPTDPTWRFTMRLGGMTARAQPDGSVGLFPPQGGDVPLLVMPKPFMTDAADDPASPYGKRYSNQVTQTIAQHGDHIEITVRADQAWLQAPERRWPVVVDPTIKVQPIDWWQSLDVEIRSDLPTTNFDNIWQLAVGSTTAIKSRSLVRFPLTDIPSGTQIASAQLQTWFDGSWGVSPDTAVTIEARRVTASWTDQTATWNSINTAIAEAGLSTASRGINQSAAWHSFDVRNIVQTWLNGTQPNYGFMLKASNETLNQGGPVYEAAPGLASYGYDYGGETQNGPKLLVTYGRPSVNLNVPTTITATGAQLSWSAYVDPSTSPNDDLIEYQVHRRPNGSSTTTPTCGPTSWAWCRYESRVAVLPPGTTSFLDTSAPPTPADDPSPQGKAYDYWIVAKTRDGQASASGVQVAWLPKAGHTRVVVQGSSVPDTTLSSAQQTTGHDVLDGRTWLGVGNNSSTYGITRSLLKFPTTVVPTTATVLDADVSVWHPMTFGTAGANATYNLHKLTKAFDEATASWTKSAGTTSWTTPGGDFNATVLGNITGLNNGEEPKWRTWRGANLTSTVQGWVASPSTNLGLLAKLANETTPAERSLFLSSEVGEPLLRPRLTVTYTERTPANTYHAAATPERIAAGDTASVPVTVTNTTAQTLWGAGACPLDQYKASYFANTTLSGTASGERCESTIDNAWGSDGPTGVGVGADGFSVRWIKSQGFTAGTYTFSATADDGVRVFLDGVPLIDQWKDQAPTTYSVSRVVSAGDHEIKMEYYEAGGGATAKLSVTPGGACPLGQYQASYFANTTLSGTASGVRCEGAIDNAWGSGGPTGVGVGVDGFSTRWVKTQQFTAGTYTFTATADDGVRVWLDTTLLIDQWKDQPPTTYTISQAVAAGSHTVKMEYYEAAGDATAKLGIRGMPSQLTYKWLLPDGGSTEDPASAASQLQTALPRDLPPGSTVAVDASVMALTPTDPGATRIDRVLTWDLYNPTSNTYLSAASGGVAGLGQHVGVEQPTSDELGLEKFYQYAGKNTGSGTTALVNTHAGNLVWSYNPLATPSRGPKTFVRMTYNSLDTSTSAMGFGWSLSAASVMRLGTPLQFHPPGQDWPTTVRLTDGDGTTHTFTLNKHGTTDPAVWDYDHPLGVHLYLQKLSSTDTARAWVLTRPDRTQFLFDADGYQSATRDNNGNELLFTWERRKSNNKPIKFLKYLTDAATRQTLTLSYYTKGQSYSYYDSTTGSKISATNLTNPFIIDQVASITGISDATTPARTLSLTYSDKGLLKELVDGAGTSLAKTFRFDYDMTQGNRNVKLVKVTDPRGHATNLVYYDPPGDPQFHWWTQTLTDRLGKSTGFAYVDPDGPQGATIQATATDARSNPTTYVTDGFGRPTSSTNAKGEQTQMTWDGDHNVASVREANTAVTTWTYDPQTGYPLTVKDAEANKNGTPAIVMTYNTTLNGHVADLASKTSPEGRKWTFGYDTSGNLTSVTDPKGTATSTANDYTTTYTYDSLGQLSTVRDANSHPTTYSNYEANGFPRTITDALGKATKFVYDVRGDVTTATDALQHDTTQSYDVFGRPLSKTEPKNQATGELITTPAPVYDANDNVTQATAANGAVTTATYDDADQMISSTLPKDSSTDPDRTTTYAYDAVGNLVKQTEPNGTLSTTNPDDFVTTYDYDVLNRLIAITDALGDKLTYAYDDVGNVVTVVDPSKNATADPSDYTTKYVYDQSHRATTVTDALGFSTGYEYDKDGLSVGVTDKEGRKTIGKRDERGDIIEVDVPHVQNGTTITYRITKYEYDQVGNQTRTITPRGVATTTDPNDFVSEKVYDELDRLKMQRMPYSAADPRYNTAAEVTYGYDDVGNLIKVSAPPSEGQAVRNDTVYSYFDNGWVKSSTDPWGITTSYDYNALGQQSIRTLTGAGATVSDASGRTMRWDYYPDGKLKSRTDDGVAIGKQVVLVDNSDSQSTSTVGTWTRTSSSGGSFQGYDYATHPAGTGSDKFTWNLVIPQDGTYEVFVRYTGATATNATYTITSSAGTAPKAVNQTTNAGNWVSLGSFTFSAASTTQQVVLSDNANGSVTADAVKLVRNNTGEADNEKQDFLYLYDPDANLKTLQDLSPGTATDAYAVTYDGLDRVATVTEKAGTAVKHTTNYSYDANSNPLTRTHDQETASYEYDARDLVRKVTNRESPTDPTPKVETFTYTPNGWQQRQTRGNGNTVDDTWFLDGLLQHEVEKKASGTIVNEHTLDYDLNGNQITDIAKKMNADNHAAYLNWRYTSTYDPRDRVVKRVKADASSGSTLDTETYTYDANSNIIDQTVGGTPTSFSYDRNRLLSSVTAGVKASYNYDPFGRLDTVAALGKTLEKNTYDNFDRITSTRKLNDAGTVTTTTKYTYDPLDRTASQTANAGTVSEKTTKFNYLGLSGDVLSEDVSGRVTKSYQYSPWGQRLSQVKHNDDGTTEDAYYGYNAHTDVEVLTDKNGDTKSTYGYSAYGKDDSAAFTGVDKPDVQNPTKEPYNFYRFNSKRWDPGTGKYDMGFRDYDPGLNRFLTRDMYKGALDDLDLGVNPWTMNRYAFGGGNPISMIELDGHGFGPGSLGSIVTHSAAMFAGAGLVALGAGVEIAGFALDLTLIGASIGVPANVAGAAIMLAGAGLATWGAAGYGEDLRAKFGHHQSEGVGSGGSGAAAAPTPVYGSEEGAGAQQDRAGELQKAREDDAEGEEKQKKKEGTTAVVRVWNKKTGEVRTWVSTSGDDSNESEEWWNSKLREGEEYIKGKKYQHAEEKILSRLGRDWQIVEGGTSRNVCGGRCKPQLEDIEIEVGGPKSGGLGDKTAYRRFWTPPPSATTTRYFNGSNWME